MFTEYFKNIQHRKPQRAKSIFTNDIFSINYSYVSILESNETFFASPPQLSRHAIVRLEISLFSQFQDSIREILTDNKISPFIRDDLQQRLAWFKIDYFQHILDIISQARKSFRSKTANELKLADKTDYVWCPEWSHVIFFNNPNVFSSAAIATASVHRDYLRVTPLITDTTPWNLKTILNDNTSNNILTSTFISTQEILNGTKNRTN